MQKKTILCYGDSNTYGYNPENGLRYRKDERWTGILSNLLGNDFTVIEEGCNGRTATFKYEFDETAISRSKMLSTEYKIIADEKNVVFFDAAKVASASKLDALHLTRDSHRALAEALKDIILSF